MRRRTVLASAGSVLLAGCVGSLPADEPSSTTTDRMTTNPPTETDTPADEFTVSEFDVSSTKVAPQKRYFLRITSVYSTAAVEREEGDQTIRDVSEIDEPELRATTKDILSEGKLWRDEIPTGLRELVEQIVFFTWEANTDPDDTATHWGIAVYRPHPERKPVVEFAAELVDDRVTPADPGVIAFSVTNTGEQTQAIFSGTVPPFSVLWAEAPGEDDQALLWRNYPEEGCVTLGEVNGEPAMMTCDIGITTSIDPGETIEKRYELRSEFEHDALTAFEFNTPGQYAVSETLSYHRQDEHQGPSTEVDWRVTFRVEAT